MSYRAAARTNGTGHMTNGLDITNIKYSSAVPTRREVWSAPMPVSEKYGYLGNLLGHKAFDRLGRHLDHEGHLPNEAVRYGNMTVGSIDAMFVVIGDLHYRDVQGNIYCRRGSRV